jgi:hypothetical protein
VRSGVRSGRITETRKGPTDEIGRNVTQRNVKGQGRSSEVRQEGKEDFSTPKCLQSSLGLCRTIIGQKVKIETGGTLEN